MELGTALRGEQFVIGNRPADKPKRKFFPLPLPHPPKRKQSANRLSLLHLPVNYQLPVIRVPMAPPRRKVLATAEETMIPPDELAETHHIVRALKGTGNNIYQIEFPDKSQMLAELPARFRSTFWIKRGSYLLVDTKAQEERDNKIGGEIINIVRDEKAWRKAPFWYAIIAFALVAFEIDRAFFVLNYVSYRPAEFVKQPVVAANSDSDSEEESRVGKMPSSDESDA